MDVYAFGILLNQILSFEKPWNGFNNGQILTAISNRERPPRSELTPQPLLSLIFSCWRTNPGERLNFSEILTRLDSFLNSRNTWLSTPLPLRLSDRDGEIRPTPVLRMGAPPPRARPQRLREWFRRCLIQLLEFVARLVDTNRLLLQG